ncbi:MAG: NlpC/P60 family protein [Candidatus Nanopelagicales bacterium]
MAAVFAVVLGVVGGAPAHADPSSPPPAGPNPAGGNAPVAAGLATTQASDYFGGPPSDCPDTVAANATFARQVDWRKWCLDAVALAPTYEAERAIKWGFARLGAPYDVNNRTTSAFDCSSFVGRAFRAAGAPVAARNGVRYDFFPYFGYTGAYVPSSSPVSMWGGGYEGTNVIRVTKAELRPGDIVVQFFGADPAQSQGNQGHAKIFLGGNRVIEAGGAARVRADMGWMDTGSYFTGEWYFRYQSLGSEKPGYSTQLAAGTYKMLVGQPNESVIGNLTVASPQAKGNALVYTCGTPRPLASSTQFTAGRTTAALAAVKLDPGGNLCIHVTSRAHLIWDQMWASSNNYAQPDALLAHAPVRKLDTRLSGGRVPAGGIREIDTGAANQTVMATLSVEAPVGVGHTQVFPCDVDGTPGIDPLPGASTNNFANARTANLATVRADANGLVCVFSSGETDLIWDQVVETDKVDAKIPTRLFDSRLPSGSPVANNGGHRLDPKDPAKVVQIAAGIPGATVIGNVTATDAVSAAHVKIVPCASLIESDTSVLNFPVGQTVSNAVIAQADWSGNVCFKVKDWTHLIWDQTVVSTGLGHQGPIERKMDSREPFKRPVPTA